MNKNEFENMVRENFNNVVEKFCNLAGVIGSGDMAVKCFFVPTSFSLASELKYLKNKKFFFHVVKNGSVVNSPFSLVYSKINSGEKFVFTFMVNKINPELSYAYLSYVLEEMPTRCFENKTIKRVFTSEKISIDEIENTLNKINAEDFKNIMQKLFNKHSQEIHLPVNNIGMFNPPVGYNENTRYFKDENFKDNYYNILHNKELWLNYQGKKEDIKKHNMKIKSLHNEIPAVVCNNAAIADIDKKIEDLEKQIALLNQEKNKLSADNDRLLSESDWEKIDPDCLRLAAREFQIKMNNIYNLVKNDNFDYESAEWQNAVNDFCNSEGVKDFMSSSNFSMDKLFNFS